MTFILPADWMSPVFGLEMIAVVAAFGLGATVGSFLNVVVHRAPRRESVVGGRSYCPACGSRVRARDNVPIIGWLLLRGRCRDCRRPIPARYPLVEAACGLLLAALALAQISAPGRGGMQPGTAVDRLVMRGDWRPLLEWLDHAAILLTLVAWAEFARRGNTVSRASVAVAVVGAVTAVALVPAVAVPGILGAPAWELAGSGPFERLTPALLGCAVGRALGALAGSPPLARGLMLVGAASGWQGVAAATALTLAGRATRRLTGDPAAASSPEPREAGCATAPPPRDATACDQREPRLFPPANGGTKDANGFVGGQPDLTGWDLVVATAVQFMAIPDSAAPFTFVARKFLGSR